MNPLFRATFKIDIEKMYRSAAWNRRAETHAGRVEALVISRSRIKVKKDRQRLRQTDTRPLLYTLTARGYDKCRPMEKNSDYARVGLRRR